MKNIMLTIGFVALFLIIAGCAQTYDSALYRNWGAAYETAKYEQTLDVNAGEEAGPVTGMDGQAAQKTFTAYRGGFSEASTSAVSGGDLTISGVE